MDKTGNAFYGPVTFHGPMFDIHDNQHVENHVHYNDNEELRMKNEESSNNEELRMKDNEELGMKNEESEGDSSFRAERDSSFFITPDALALLERLRRVGVVDEAWRPVGLSAAEKGVLASYVASRLGIATPWQTFARLWDLRPDTLRAAYNKGMEQKKTARFLERVKGNGI